MRPFAFLPPSAPRHPGRRSVLQGLAAGACALALAPGAAPALAQQGARGARSDIVVGRSTALTGPLAPFMAPIHEAHEAAIADFNAQGGVGGRKVRLVTLDDGFDARRTLDNARQLVEREGAVALFGQAGTSQVMALLPYLERARTPLVAVYTGSPAPRAAASAWLFTTSASYSDELAQIVRNLVATQSARIAIAYEDNDFGKLTLPLAQQIATAEGATVVATQAMHSSGQDAGEVARALAAQRPQAVLMVAAGPSVVAYVRAHRAQLGVPLYTLSLGAGAHVIRALGDDARGLAVARTTPSPRRATLAVTREFQASMKRHGLEPDYDRYIGYLDARVLLEALRAAGPAASGESVARAMEGLGPLDLGGHTYRFGPGERNGSRFVDIAVIGPGGQYMR
ncbi:ABC transporter substrate-binding protein [Pulveribacter suum]|uniref:ABC transporter substrate-binding protein n=1 Tax=Pulveribacter suum TaxID=2116657 RepID=A0A2P1NK84_9BURK|nr:ABC transporter substrate-binding protein [Pulveribacter suum]AVP57432.1 ABC transporter substrate-binding protein [Pulveribacter suum]